MTYTAPIFFCLFLPAVMLFYNLMPQKHRGKVLLAASYLFFMLISRKLIFYLILSTFSIHHFALWISTIKNEWERDSKESDKETRKAMKAAYQRKQLMVLVFAVVLHIGLLLCLKYMNFFSVNVNLLLSKMSFPVLMPEFKFALPIGISFYTLQAVSYMIDVYKGTVEADKNLGRLALYMSFFPQIMEGPICRYSQTARKLYEGTAITYRSMTFGYQRILWGLFKKIVIADRLNMLVKTVFTDYQKYSGVVILVAMACYTCQLYMDFSGSIDIVIGSGEIFGLRMPENFRQPFFSKSVSEFWVRWHITLGSWFKDYIFYPLSLSKPFKKLTSKGRKHLGNHFGPLLTGSCALFVVWFCNGLWHGAAWKYIFFGMYYFVLILLASITEPVSKKGLALLHINKNKPAYLVWQIIRTVCLVNIGELFFRAKSLRAGLLMFQKMVAEFAPSAFRDGTLLKLGMDRQDFIIIILAVVIVFTVSIFHEKGIRLREKISGLNPLVRWTIYYAIIIIIVIFGAYGTDYAPADIIYAGF